jgi:hypothetical protein
MLDSSASVSGLTFANSELSGSIQNTMRNTFAPPRCENFQRTNCVNLPRQLTVSETRERA